MRGHMVRVGGAAAFIAASMLSLASLSACDKAGSDGNDNTASTGSLAITVNAMALDNASKNAALSVLGRHALIDGPETPDTAKGEYDGMGVMTSDAVVEGFTIKLTTVTFGKKQDEGGLGGGSELSFNDAELDISKGVNKPVSATGDLQRGSYDYVSVGFRPWYRLKAYAYMDIDNDGTTDTTVFTTASAVVKQTGRLTAAELTAAGYADYEYGFTYTHCSNSATKSTEGECSTISLFPKPINTEGNVAEPKDEDGDGIPDEEVIDTSKDVVVNLLIDSTKVVTAWTGGVGAYTIKGDIPTADILGDATKVPIAKGFPLSTECSDTKNQWGLNSCDFFKVGTPAFKLNYLPAFAFLETDGLTSHVYSVSKESGSWNHYNSGTVQLVFNGGVPTVGLVFNDSQGEYDYSVKPTKIIRSPGPVLGSVARIFEKAADNSYTFHMDGHNQDANGKDDGGLYYNNDKTMAGHIVTKFTPAANVGDTGTMVVNDGPRCKGEYDYCVGERTYYWKRIK